MQIRKIEAGEARPGDAVIEWYPIGVPEMLHAIVKHGLPNLPALAHGHRGYRLLIEGDRE